MRERNHCRNLERFGWALAESQPAPLDSAVGWELFQREAARCRRHRSRLSLISLRARAELGSRVAGLVRDYDLVSVGDAGELLLLLPDADEQGAVGCVARLSRELADVPSAAFGYAELQSDESVDSLIARARRDREHQPVRVAA